MKSPIVDHFDRFSEGYRLNFSGTKTGRNFEFLTREQLIKGHLRGVSGKLLDCACGSGEISRAAIQAGNFSQATLVDISKEMLTFARQQFKNLVSDTQIELVEADIFHFLKGTAERYDVILCLGLIAHTGRLDRLLSLLTTLLNPGGVILLQSSLADHPGVRIVRMVAGRRHARRTGYSITYYRQAELEETIAATGLRIREMSRYCLGIPFGDSLFPAVNYWLERKLQGLTARLGSEAIFVLEQAGIEG